MTGIIMNQNLQEEKHNSTDIATFLIQSFYEAPNFKHGLHNQNLLNGEGQSIMIAATYVSAHSLSFLVLGPYTYNLM